MIEVCLFNQNARDQHSDNEDARPRYLCVSVFDAYSHVDVRIRAHSRGSTLVE
jgi:hypothetical protein